MQTEQELLKELATLAKEYPQAFNKTIEQNPSLAKPVLDYARAKNAGLSFTPEGFSDWFYCLFGYELAPHARNVWTPKMFEAYQNKTGVLLEGFRGATKSAFMFAWPLFVTGHNPVGSTVLCRINDQAAAETARAMAGVIAESPAWKTAFPNVIPITSKWSTDGYYVRDARVDEGKWGQMLIADHLGEPSILCAGIASGIHIGKHPSNGWYFDDFHDIENTRRHPKEMAAIVDIIEQNIVPTWTRPGSGHPTLGGACTLWDEKDGYHALLRTGMFEHIKMPIFTIDPEGIEWPGLVHHGEKINLTWPEGYPLEKVLELEQKDPLHFAQNYLCDLSSMKGTVLKRDWLHEYPQETVDPTWPVYMAVDFASTEDKLKNKDTDFFCLAVGRVVPGGGVVAVPGGFRGRISLAEALQKVTSIASMYPTLQSIGIEKWGTGRDLLTMLVYQTNLPVIPVPEEGKRGISKGSRFQDEMASMFMTSRAWVSSAKDDYLLSFEDEWVSWDGGRSRTGHDDALDAMYWMLYCARGFLQAPARTQGIKTQKKKSNSPLAGMGKVRGYG